MIRTRSRRLAEPATNGSASSTGHQTRHNHVAKGMANGIHRMDNATPEVADAFPGLTFATFGGNRSTAAAWPS